MENQTGTTESTPPGDAATEATETESLGTSSAGSSEGRSSGFDAAAAVVVGIAGSADGSLGH